nr:MAG TPA: hypothetical protein [Caudoviricetes sp.]
MQKLHSHWRKIRTTRREIEQKANKKEGKIALFSVAKIT